jgi:transposase
VQREYDKELYKARHLIENFFAKLELFRAIATRYDKQLATSSPQFTLPLLPFGSFDDTL